MTDTNENLVRHEGHITLSDRSLLLGQMPATVWLTGLSGSGKSTLAFGLERQLFQLKHPCFVLDGDNVRHGLCKDLGFSAADRSENIRRISEVARLLNDAGIIVITTFISPYRSDRELARDLIGPERFVEVYLSTPLGVCEQRDRKDLYRRARAGAVKEFTGISSPYEPPTAPALTIDSSCLCAKAGDRDSVRPNRGAWALACLVCSASGRWSDRVAMNMNEWRRR